MNGRLVKPARVTCVHVLTAFWRTPAKSSGLQSQCLVNPSDPVQSNPDTRSAYKSSVIFRLRATFLFMALVSCGATAFGFWQLDKLDRSHAQLVGDAVPTLRHTHDLQRELSELLELVSRVENVRTLDALDTLQIEYTKKISAIQKTIKSNMWPSHTQQIRAQIAHLLTTLQRIQTAGFARRTDVIEISEKLREFWQKLRQTREDFRELIEPLLIESAAQLRPDDIETRQDDSTADLKRQASVSARIISQMNLTQISYRFSALIDTAENRLPDASAKTVDDWTNKLRFEFSGVMQVLIRLEASSDRERIARALVSTRNILFSETGLAASMSNRASVFAELSKSNLQRLSLVDSITSYANRLVTTASDDADAASVSFRNDLSRAVLVMAITMTVVLIVLGAVWALVVERQINRRMSRLTDTVSAIADGDIDAPVDITGNDELGKMGTALNVFKSNATELRQSNEELESFAYAAAHDLRSPLRAIENLARWTLEDAGDSLQPESRKNLEKLISRANRLSKLQADLLDYSRVGKTDTEQRPLELLPFVQSIQELLDVDHRFQFNIQVPARLTIEVAEIPLRQILINLMTNAIKHHDRDSGEIRVEAEVRESQLHMRVSDNGPGIEPQFHQRIFKLFQTLKSRDLVEGSGLGLSFVQRQIDRCGGHIRVISDPVNQRGTSFVFYLPARLIERTIDDASPLARNAMQELVTESP